MAKRTKVGFWTDDKYITFLGRRTEEKENKKVKGYRILWLINMVLCSVVGLYFMANNETVAGSLFFLMLTIIGLTICVEDDLATIATVAERRK